MHKHLIEAYTLKAVHQAPICKYIVFLFFFFTRLLRRFAVSTLRIYPSADERRGWEAMGGLFALITPAVDDNRSLAGWIIKDLPASTGGKRTC